MARGIIPTTREVGAVNAAEVLTAITLAVSAWTLLRVIRLGEEMAAMKQKIRDFPCGSCDLKEL